ncbi:uncharacterized protein LOC125660160 [Ostrea edulis]|uniref:uncharacterized protein LOC125660160 n=1 Tax=Ostrea edulis TaxID=37623 RepID=UPI0024AEF288|nr:uncharacterized protein LOC125660160 [Ostrea edulis]
MKSFEYKEIVDLRDKIPTSGSPVLYGYPSITTCAVECSKTDSCQMFFHKSDWQACILYEFFVWNSNFGVASNGFRAFKMKTVGNQNCDDANDIFNRAAGMCFRQYNTNVMITRSDAIANCSARGSDLIVLNTMQKKTFLEKYVRETNAVPGLVGLSDAVEGQFKWRNGEPLDLSHWGVGGYDFNNIDISRPGVFCLKADCGWVGLYLNVFMVWDNCCSKTSDWFCAYNP